MVHYFVFELMCMCTVVVRSDSILSFINLWNKTDQYPTALAQAPFLTLNTCFSFLLLDRQAVIFSSQSLSAMQYNTGKPKCSRKCKSSRSLDLVDPLFYLFKPVDNMHWGKPLNWKQI